MHRALAPPRRQAPAPWTGRPSQRAPRQLPRDLPHHDVGRRVEITAIEHRSDAYRPHGW